MMTQRTLRWVSGGLLVAMTGLVGCETMNNNRTATGAGIGAVGGAIAGALIDKDNRWRGGAIGAAAGAAVGGGIGYVLQKQKESFDRIQELEARQQTVYVQPPPPPPPPPPVVAPGQPPPPPPPAATPLPPVQREALNLTIQADVLFAQGSSALSAGGARKIAEVATVLRDYPESSIIVRGFTSSEGEDAMNVDLSQRRATAVANEIVANRIAPQRVQAQGMGESMPIADNNTELGRQRNRRVEVLVIPYDEVK